MRPTRSDLSDDLASPRAVSTDDSMTDADSFAIRRAGPGDISTVLGLLREHHGAQYDILARHEWLYRRNPHGLALTFIAFDRESGDPCGLTSLFPRKLAVRGAERLASIGGDGFVRPRFRRRGIATALHRQSLRKMGEAGVELMYGPPEPHNLAALLRAGSAIVCQLRRFVRPLDFSRLASWGSALSPLRGWLRPRRSPLRLRAMTNGDTKLVDGVWDRTVRDLVVAPIRDRDYYAWRFVDCPSGKQRAYLVLDGGEVVGICALERNGHHTVILDIVAPRNSYAAMVEAICSFCRDDAAIETRLNERGPIASLLWQYGFVPRDRKPFQVLMSEEHPRVDELFRPQAWYYTTGDGDVETVL